MFDSAWIRRLINSKRRMSVIKAQGVGAHYKHPQNRNDINEL
jgi:hypothetical protein